MKNKVLYIISAALIVITGCKKDSSTNPLIPGGGTTSEVTIKINSQLDQQGGAIFSGSPNVAVKVTKITASVPAQQYTESFNFDGTNVINANVSTQFLQYPANSGVASGQKWTFQFEGNLADNNQAFIVTSDYTIP